MTIERARIEAHFKPWGVDGILPWSTLGGRVGELCFERADAAQQSQLQLKLLFTNQPLSIHVHPGDEQATEAGFVRGKTEAWLVLSASANAKVGVGLVRTCSEREVRAAAEQGALVALIDWRSAFAGDVINVPAGTIHAIGEGLVIAEIQQRSDLTYHLYDYDRDRQLDIDQALAVANLGAVQVRVRFGRLSDQRQLLSTTPYFCFEQITLAPGSRWRIETPCETWVLCIDGKADIAEHLVARGEAVFLEREHGSVQAGPEGAKLLAAYAQPNVLPYLLQRAVSDQPDGPFTPSGHSLLGKTLQRAVNQTAERPADR